MISYPAKIQKEGKFYEVRFIDLPDAITQGETMEELMENAEDVISLALIYFLDQNKEIPQPSKVEGKDIVYIHPRYDVALPIMLKKRRKELNWSQSEAASKMNVKYQTYQKLEKARINPTLKTLERAARVLGKKLVLDMV